MVTQDSQPPITTGIYPRPGSYASNGWSYPSNLTNVNGTLYFTADDSINGQELWKIDSTGNAVIVKDINPGANSSDPFHLTNFEGTLYFEANDAVNGNELWRIDSTGNAVLVKDINPGAGSSYISDLTTVNGTTYFTASSINGQELWKVDSTGNAVIVKDFSVGTDSSYLSSLTNVDGTLYFMTSTFTENYLGQGQQLWKIDNSGNAVVVNNLSADNDSSWSPFTNVNGDLYFTKDKIQTTVSSDNMTTDIRPVERDLWKISSTGNGNAVFVKNINSGADSYYPANLTNVNGTLYFTANGSANGEELWRVGSTGNPVLVKNINSGAELYSQSYLTNVNGTLYFITSDTNTGRELWKIDNAGNPILIKDINPGTESSSPSTLTNVNGTLYFTANNSTNGDELWRIDSTGDVVLVKDINPGTESSSPQNLTSVNGTLYFTARNSINGQELWKVDSTGNAVLVKDINLGADSSRPSTLTNVDGTLYFTAYNTTTGRELWRIDSTGDAVLVKDINPEASPMDMLGVVFGPNGRGEFISETAIEPVVGLTAAKPEVFSFNRNLLETTSAVKGLSLQAISQKQTNKVNEIGFFNVDDRDGKIGGIALGEAGYIKAAIERSKSILTTLGGDFFNTDKQEIGLDPNKIYQFFEVENGSLTEVKQQLDRGENPTNIRLSISDVNGNSPIKVTGNSIQSGYNVSINNDELVLKVTKLDGIVPNRPIGSDGQGKTEGRIIDLTKYKDRSLTVDITTKSDAVYQSQIGFYVVKDTIGTIELADGTTVKPGDVNYAMVAIKNAIANGGLQANRIDNKTNQPIAGGQIYAPVVVAQGTMNDFVNNTSNNIQVYFNYIGANTDKVDHFRQIGANTFGVEDMYGGGDRDFNDIVIQMNIKTA
jgi:trimeric autotransporter adhesin